MRSIAAMLDPGFFTSKAWSKKIIPITIGVIGAFALLLLVLLAIASSNTEFFDNYFQLLKPGIFENEEHLFSLYYKLDFFRKDDSPETIAFLKDLYFEMISLLSKPFQTAQFDFSDKAFFLQIYTMGEGFSKNKTFRKMNNARGSKDAIYVMRTFFGLYSLLHQLEATVELNYTLD